ncbi:DUF6651 domain-containing protein [Acinetobacter stercoris]|uniref:DUF6651 domain-containing protein n=1 Tax=Acinetobacter stercoris TaxID=2126983 RepID=A0A2U3MUP4_9GAMM|nr:DUF6651 domain-containing protein [Acinetobacter stercoris]SPL69157.1 hypothetical protein KPC_0335 [Acinetobacter stercoris]
MKLKLDENGHVVVQDGKPVYVHDDGKEVVFDAPQTVSTINRLTGELKTTREAKEKAETALTAFEGIDNPADAIKALQTVRNLDDKKLVDAGEVEKVKAEAIKAVEDKFAPVVQERDALQTQLNNELIGGGFARSKFIQDNVSVPVDMIQAQFGKNFKIEEGKVVAYGADGQKVFSRSRPGEIADFDEAIETLIGGYQYKDQILKGGQGSGGNFAGQGNANAGLKRSQMDAKAKADYIRAHGQESYLKLEK